MEEINRKILIGERALFQKEDLLINECIFEDGESPLKESKNIILIQVLNGNILFGIVKISF